MRRGLWLACMGLAAVSSLSAQEPKLRETLRGHTADLWSVAFSPDGKELASGSADRTVKLWDVVSGKNTATLAGHTDDVMSVAFSPDGKILASSAADNVIRMWDVATGKAIATLNGHTEPVRYVTFSHDGKTLASGSWDKTIRLWDVATGKTAATLTKHTREITSVVFSPNGKKLASASRDRTINLWDVASRKNTATLTWSHPECLVFSPDGKTLASAGGMTIAIWNVMTNKCTIRREWRTRVTNCLAYSPNGKILVSGAGRDVSTKNKFWDVTIKFWDVSTGENTTTLIEHTDSVDCLAFSPDGKTLASGSGDRTIKLWDVPVVSRANEGYAARVLIQEFRMWTDSTGQHKIEAKFDGLVSGNVKLIKKDGTSLQIPVEKLSDEDQQWIKAGKK